jgi:hypothetical protein
MAKERTSVRMQAQIKVLSEQGHSVRSSARILRLSRRTVRKFLEPAPHRPQRTAFGWRQWTGVCSRGSLWQRDHGQTDPARGGPRHRLRKVLAGLSRASGPSSLPRSSDDRARSHAREKKSQIDFCDGLFITDRITGNKTHT